MSCHPTCERPAPSQAHCGGERGCHLTFGSVRAFDDHRKSGACLDPVALGMSPNDRGVWRVPLPDDAAARLAAHRAKEATS